LISSLQLLIGIGDYCIIVNWWLWFCNFIHFRCKLGM